jgi:hypothetical protein
MNEPTPRERELAEALEAAARMIRSLGGAWKNPRFKEVGSEWVVTGPDGLCLGRDARWHDPLTVVTDSLAGANPVFFPTREAAEATLAAARATMEAEVTESQHLRAAIVKAREQLEAIVCTEGCDSGVILVSWESPTRYDNELRAQVYLHEHFSPLGDALIALHATLKGAA